MSTSDDIGDMLHKLEVEIDSIPTCEPEQLEQLLQELHSSLHENHYLVSDCKRRLIDIYGHEKEYEYENLSQEKLEKKSDFCNQLLHLSSKLSPGKSELRG